jgi:CRP-like cAMP-binding protein
MISPEDIRRIPFFEDAPAAVVDDLVGEASLERVEANTYLLHQHDEVNFVFFLMSGRVQVLLEFHGMDRLFVGKIQEPGALIGWSAFRTPYRSTSTIRTEGECELLRISRAPLLRLLEEIPDFGYPFLARVAESLANRLEVSRNLLIMARPAPAG